MGSAGTGMVPHLSYLCQTMYLWCGVTGMGRYFKGWIWTTCNLHFHATKWTAFLNGTLRLSDANTTLILLVMMVSSIFLVSSVRRPVVSWRSAWRTWASLYLILILSSNIIAGHLWLCHMHWACRVENCLLHLSTSSTCWTIRAYALWVSLSSIICDPLLSFFIQFWHMISFLLYGLADWCTLL